MAAIGAMQANYVTRLDKTLKRLPPCLNVYDEKFSQEVNTQVFYCIQYHFCARPNCPASECSKIHAVITSERLAQELTRIEMGKSIYVSQWLNGLILWARGRACERRVYDLINVWNHVFCK